MQWNESYETSAQMSISTDSDDIYENPEEFTLSPVTSDDIEYPQALLTKKIKKNKRRKLSKCLLGATGILTVIFCVAALSTSLALLVLKMDRQLQGLKNEMKQQNSTLFSLLANQQDTGAKTQEKYSFNQSSCFTEKRECSIDISGQAFTNYYWVHCNTEFVHINTSVSQ